MAGNPAELGLLRVNFRTADRDALAAFKAAFLADGTEEEFLTFLNTFQPDENLDVGTSADRAQAATWGTVPKTFVRLTDDASMPLAMQDRLIREGDALTPDNPYETPPRRHHLRRSPVTGGPAGDWRPATDAATHSRLPDTSVRHAPLTRSDRPISPDAGLAK
ncbi:hypothetical protein H4N49_02380 [Streptomyces sp. DHE17-7]|nr:hypothetical protein [Streptomyces sp. DHE17-7]